MQDGRQNLLSGEQLPVGSDPGYRGEVARQQEAALLNQSVDVVGSSKGLGKPGQPSRNQGATMNEPLLMPASIMPQQQMVGDASQQQQAYHGSIPQQIWMGGGMHPSMQGPGDEEPDMCCFPGETPIGHSGRIGGCATYLSTGVNLFLPGVGIAILSCVGHSQRGLGYGILFMCLTAVAVGLILSTILTAIRLREWWQWSLLGIGGTLGTFLLVINIAWSCAVCLPRPQAEVVAFLIGTVGIRDHRSAETYATHLAARGFDSAAIMSEASFEQLVGTCLWKPGHLAALNAWLMRRSTVTEPGLQPIPAYSDAPPRAPPQVTLRILCPVCSIFSYEGCSGSCLAAFLLLPFGWVPASLYAALVWVPVNNKT